MKFLQYVLLTAPLAVTLQLDRRGKVVYDGYKIFRVTPGDDIAAFESHLESLEAIDLTHNHGHVDEEHFDVAVPPESLSAFEELNFTSTVLSEDLGADIALEGDLAEYPAQQLSAAALPNLSWFSAYHAYADHLTFLKDIQSSFSSNSELITAGKSFEGRDIQGIHLWGSGGKGSKPAIIWHGNVHAREWISSKVVEYLTYQLVNNYSNDTTIKSALDSYDFYILPIVNPDGFLFTQTSNRLWRKNRQTRSGSSAIGTDVNRNWPYKWDGEGSSTSPGSETYRGAAAGDTPENTGIRALGDKLTNTTGIKLYVDWHSYGQYILTPYGYSCTAAASNQDKQNSLARSLATAIAKPYGTRFTAGPTCATLYATAGGSNDYVTDVNKAEYGWAIELRDTGRNGFTLPADQILPTGIEIWEGMKYLFANF
ncbi:uncharacterized protein GGS22DRAFT_79637 [Annulohypoxylon maeteangense]|uniref:uncharacterized protein n=1 Tax=Annulohypoxylon maeteangense TaxID=1927788 RepID=UPI002008DC9E|nr:uncharacterized protein GGS22DRAFT_79637 [Annulohypoxylon maeteangense]KAI0880751.1 hypothetical protein GGS22DRAFT_79637 [Annulohypoxylon maeteangense]